MSATNQTAVYGLPIFLGTDVPSWLTDWNGAMGDIDTAIAAAKAAADAAASTAGTAATDIVTINGQITSLQNTVGTHTTQIGTISGNINTINSLIGNGTPTTTDQTIIGAINELHADQGDLADLQTTDKSSLVAAINEAAQSGGGGSDTVRYYNGFLQYTPDNGVTWVNFYNTAPEVALVPAMTSNTTPSGVASASSENVNREAYHAFDQNDSEYWGSTGATNEYVQYNFGSQKVVTKAAIKALYATQARVKNFKIQASNDGVTFVDLYTGVYQNDNTEPLMEVTINNLTPYQYYRLLVVDTYYDNAAVKTFQVYGN